MRSCLAGDRLILQSISPPGGTSSYWIIIICNFKIYRLSSELSNILTSCESVSTSQLHFHGFMRRVFEIKLNDYLSLPTNYHVRFTRRILKNGTKLKISRF